MRNKAMGEFIAFVYVIIPLAFLLIGLTLLIALIFLTPPAVRRIRRQYARHKTGKTGGPRLKVSDYCILGLFSLASLLGLAWTGVFIRIALR